MHAVVRHVDRPHVETLPAMLPNLHIRLGGHSAYALAGGGFVPAPAVTLIGPTSAAYRIALGPGFRLLSVGLLPAGWEALVGAPAAECTDRMLAADDVWGDGAVAQLLACLCERPFSAGLCQVVESFLQSLARPTASRRTLQRQIVDRWLETSATLSLDELASALDVGARQLRRITEETHGVAPKRLALKYRALRLAAALAQPRDIPRSHEADLALSLYADQSHAIRDFQRFVGRSPVAFQREPQGIARATLTGRLAARAHRPLALPS